MAGLPQLSQWYARAWAPKSPKGPRHLLRVGSRQQSQFEGPLRYHDISALIRWRAAFATIPLILDPGGSSTPIFTEDELDTPSTESVGAAGSMLGARAPANSTRLVSVVRCITRWSEFYQHGESCGKCAHCREGTCWIEANHAASRARRRSRRSTCSTDRTQRGPLPLRRRHQRSGMSGIKRFRDEFEATASRPPAAPTGRPLTTRGGGR